MYAYMYAYVHTYIYIFIYFYCIKILVANDKNYFKRVK